MEDLEKIERHQYPTLEEVIQEFEYQVASLLAAGGYDSAYHRDIGESLQDPVKLLRHWAAEGRLALTPLPDDL